jgi:hypothetical protein
MQVTCERKFWMALIPNHLYRTDLPLLSKGGREVGGGSNEIALNTTRGEEGEL